jgi:hypothetical protein
MIRFDAAIARAISHIKGGEASKYMPYPREEEPEATPEMALLLLKAAMKPKTKVKKNG